MAFSSVTSECERICTWTNSGLRMVRSIGYGHSMIAEKIPELCKLSSDQKILLAAELWREAVGPEAETPNPAMVRALRERLDYYRAHPEQVSTWEEVRARIASRKAS
jgi:hypothetical protein